MFKFTTINRPVAITALGFSRDMRVTPRRIELDGRSYTFVDEGIRTRVKRNGQLSQILTMSDGERMFRLRSDGRGGNWTLLGITE